MQMRQMLEEYGSHMEADGSSSAECGWSMVWFPLEADGMVPAGGGWKFSRGKRMGGGGVNEYVVFASVHSEYWQWFGVRKC